MAATRTLSQFKSKLSGGGARPNLFEVSIPAFPSAIESAWGSGDDAENGLFKFMCKAAQLPASTIANVDVPFRGRILKVAGDRTFAPWTISVINDENFIIRTAFERWANVVSKLDDATGVTNPSSYMTDAYVQQLGRGSTINSTTNDGANSSVLRTYKFYDIFPTNISEIALSYDTGDTIEQFDVEFQVQYFTIGNSQESSNPAPEQSSVE
tara:strand:- start:943 stop:1575 length:633 start_codon:yes stop_codon:yes gene_type:complete